MMKEGKKRENNHYYRSVLTSTYLLNTMSLRCLFMTLKGHDMFYNYLEKVREGGKRAFTFKQILQEMNLSEDSAKSGLYRLKKEGKIISPAKGLYVIVPPEHQSYGSIPAEELLPLLMKHLKVNYYVSLLSGATFYGAAHQKPARFQFITNKRIKHPLEFGEVKLELIYKKSLTDLPTRDFVVSTGYLKVASPELIAIDLLNYSSRAGGLNHIATVLSELIESMDENKLISLAEKITETYQLQRLGYMLEKIETMDEDKTAQIVAKLEECLSGKMKAYVPLASEIAKVGYPRVKKWKIIENTTIESDL